MCFPFSHITITHTHTHTHTGTDAFGAVGTVTAVDVERNAVQLRLVTRPKLPPFGLRIVKAVKDKYHGVRTLSRELKIPYGVLLKITGSVLVKEKGRNSKYNEHTDVGLNFRVYGRLVVPGFMRARDCVKKSSIKNAWLNPFATMKRVSNAEGNNKNVKSHEWELTEEACSIVRDYVKRFPKIVEVVKANPGARDFPVSELFPEKSDGVEVFLKWKRNLRSDRLPLVPVDSVTMPQSGVKACETALNVVAKQDRKKSKVLDGKWYRVSDLLPAVVDTWMEPMKIYQGNRVRSLPSLGERVVNVGNTRVPFGLRGLVVSIHPRTRCVEVVFDEIFIGGTNLSGLCSEKRGFLMPWRHCMSFSSTGESLSISGQGFSSVVKKSSEKKVKKVERDGDLSELPLLMPFGDAKVEDGKNVEKKKKKKVKKVEKKVKKIKLKKSEEPTKKKDSPQVLTGILQRALEGGGSSNTTTTTSTTSTTKRPEASVLTSLLHKALKPTPPPKSILPVSFFDRSAVISSKSTTIDSSNSTASPTTTSSVPIHTSLQKFLKIGSSSPKIKKAVENIQKVVEKVENSPVEVKKKKVVEAKKKKVEIKKKKKEAEVKKKVVKKKNVVKKVKKEKVKKKKTKTEEPKRVVKKILTRKERKRDEDEAVVMTADGVEISLDPMAFWNEMEAEADSEYEAERKARRLQRQAERERRAKNRKAKS